MFTSFTCKERKTTCNRHPLLEDYYFTGVPYKLFGKLVKLVLDKGFLYMFKGVMLQGFNNNNNNNNNV